VADWRWECVTDDLLDGLPPDALRAIRQLAIGDYGFLAMPQ
jgi:hypothetical protein